MITDNAEVVLDIAGVGIIFHSPKSTEHIVDGTDYLASSYTSERQVQAHIQKGDIVGFGTGSPGRFILRFHTGYPDEGILHRCAFKLRLGLHCQGGVVCFRDLYDLMDWRAECPTSRMIELEDGFYHVTLCSNRPPSGMLGDNQIIDVYLQKLDTFPKLAKEGVPTLCV